MSLNELNALKIGRVLRAALALVAATVATGASADGGDAEYKALFQSWKKMDAVGRVDLTGPTMSVPSIKPVANMTFTSLFGVRSDPFRGTAAMHAGVDIPGPVGTPIYATADGIVGRSGWVGGYGNLVELDHGGGLQTRYGHLSRITVPAGSRVRRGDVIGLMGSTGRSTGSHLHYEVRMDGRAVNPMPYLDAATQYAALRTPAAAQGGPTDAIDAE